VDPVAIATWGLVAVTALLVLRSYLDDKSHERRATAELAVLRQQADALTASASALSESARASQAMADEMLEARKAEHPLEVVAQLEEGTAPGRLVASVWRAGTAGIVIARADVLAGSERLMAAAPTMYANQYLGGQTAETQKFYVNSEYARQGKDLIVLRVTGTPENGIEQSREFLYRVLPSGQLEALSGDAVWLPSTGPDGGVA